MATYTREYTKVITLNYNQLIMMSRAQVAAYEYVQNNISNNTFISRISGYAAIFALLAWKATAASVGLSLLSLATGFSTSNRATFSQMSNAGLNGLISTASRVESTGSAKVEIRLPYFEYYDWHTKEVLFTIVSAKGVIQKYYNANGDAFIPN